MNIHYAAGFFDGEGSIGVYREKHKGFYLRTQLTQKTLKITRSLLDEMALEFGGRVHNNPHGKNPRLNWHMSSNSAVEFLERILPYLRLKQTQAQIGIAWQRQRPPVTRNALGQICSKRKQTEELDIAVCVVMKALKKQDFVQEDIEQVMANQSDLVKIVAEIKQVLCVKG